MYEIMVFKTISLCLIYNDLGYYPLTLITLYYEQKEGFSHLS